MELKTRSAMLDQVIEQIYRWTYEEPDRPYFSTFYMEQGSLYGLFNGRGMLFRATVDLEADGQTLALGEMEPVMHEFTPVTRSGFTIQRQADGQYRFFMVAGTAILNRVGEIDSTLLYDDMIRRAEDHSYYPKLDFYHLGEYDSIFDFGQFDFLAREGVVYVGSGILQPDHPLTIAMVRATTEEPGKWGASIEYYRPENRGMEYVELGGGVSIVAYTEGLNTRISVLPEAAAAAWFTSVEMEKREMEDRHKKALRELFADEEAYLSFMGKIGAINQEVKTRGLVSRSNAEGQTTEQKAEGESAKATTTATVTPTEAQPASATLETTVELDDEAVKAIVAVAREQFQEVFQGIDETLTALTTSLKDISTAQTNLTATVNGMQERLAGVEQDEEVKQREWVSDLPSHLATKTKVSYRPKNVATESPEKTLAEQAASVLDRLPKVGI